MSFIYLLLYFLTLRCHLLQGLAAAPPSTTVFVAGAILNELLLMAQGISGLVLTPVHHVPLLLAVAAGTLLIGFVGLLLSQRPKGS